MAQDKFFRILIVDDEPAVLKVAAIALKKLPLKIDTSADEAQAYSLIKKYPYDIALVDLKLKEGDGLDIIREARRYHPKISSIIMTGTLTSEEFKKRVINARVDRVIFKPFTVAQIREAVNSCLLPLINRKGAALSAHPPLQSSGLRPEA